MTTRHFGWALLAICLLGCKAKAKPTPVLSPAEWAALGAEVGVKFPSSARLIGLERENGIDDLVQFKVAIKPSDLAAFLASTPLGPDAFRPGTRGYLGSDHGFWDPQKAAHLRCGQALLPAGRALNIGVADGDPGTVNLYIVNHGT